MCVYMRISPALSTDILVDWTQMNTTAQLTRMKLFQLHVTERPFGGLVEFHHFTSEVTPVELHASPKATTNLISHMNT